MILCERCGRVIQAYEVKYRLEVDGKRRTFCNEDAKEVLKQLEAKAPVKAPPPAAGKPTQVSMPTPTAPAPAAASATAGAAADAKPKLSPEELEARKKAALEKAAAAKAAKEGPKPG